MHRPTLGLSFTIALAALGCSSSADLARCTTTCGDGPFFLVNRVSFVVADGDGIADGFDLDGIVSDGKGNHDCYTTDLQAPDGRPGVDNRLAQILRDMPPELTASLQTQFQGAVDAGNVILLSEVVGKLAPGQASRFDMVIRFGTGNPVTDAEGKLLPHQSFSLADDPVAGVAYDIAYDGSAWRGGPFDLNIRGNFSKGGIEFSLLDAYYSATYDGGEIDGVVGGTIALESSLELVRALLADDESLMATIEAVLPLVMDVRSKDTGACDRLSLALKIAMIPADIVP